MYIVQLLLFLFNNYDRCISNVYSIYIQFIIHLQKQNIVAYQQTLHTITNWTR